jgi:hypothetical protein
LNKYSVYNHYDFTIEIFEKEVNRSYTINSFFVEPKSICYDSADTVTGIECPLDVPIIITYSVLFKKSPALNRW